MTSKEYVIKALKKGSAWKGTYGDMQDYALSLAGIGEPVKLSLSQPILEDPEIGDRLYGRLFQENATDGRSYYKLKLEQRPQEDIRAMDIHAQGGIKLAVKVWLNTDYESDEARQAAYRNIETEALHFARMITNVKEELKK